MGKWSHLARPQKGSGIFEGTNPNQEGGIIPFLGINPNQLGGVQTRRQFASTSAAAADSSSEDEGVELASPATSTTPRRRPPPPKKGKFLNKPGNHMGRVLDLLGMSTTRSDGKVNRRHKYTGWQLHGEFAGNRRPGRLPQLLREAFIWAMLHHKAGKKHLMIEGGTPRMIDKFVVIEDGLDEQGLYGKINRGQRGSGKQKGGVLFTLPAATLASGAALAKLAGTSLLTGGLGTLAGKAIEKIF